MRARMVVAGVAAAAAAAIAAGTATAVGGHAVYRFTGHAEASSPTSLTVTVEGGNARALRLMLGHLQTQTFTLGGGTTVLRWANGVPTVVSPEAIAPGDVVGVNVRAPRGAGLAAVEAAAASLVGDRGPNPVRPSQPLWLFRGILVGSAHDGLLPVHVQSGNRRAMRALLPHGDDATFVYDATTVFLRWRGGVPEVISAEELRPGDRVTIRVRAAAGSSLREVRSTPARHVGLHEPAAPLSPPS